MMMNPVQPLIPIFKELHELHIQLLNEKYGWSAEINDKCSAWMRKKSSWNRQNLVWIITGKVRTNHCPNQLWIAQTENIF